MRNEGALEEDSVGLAHSHLMSLLRLYDASASSSFTIMSS